MKHKTYLVVYSQATIRTRRSIKEHTKFLMKVKSEKIRIIYVNTFFQKNHYDLASIDCILLTTSFLSQKWSPRNFERLQHKLPNLGEFRGLIVAMPQDEFINTEMLDLYFETMKNLHIMTILPEKEWRKIYPRSTQKGHTFEQVLTGYINNLPKKRQKAFSKRKFEISYRAWETEPWLGKHSYKKFEICEKFAAVKRNNWNLSTKKQDVLVGKSWDRLLQNSKFVIGTEQGASISDPHGILREKYQRYKERNANADWITSYQDLNFEHFENSIELKGLSPRVFEAMQNNVGLILLEGQYNGVLNPNRHFLQVREDYSNLDEIIQNLDEETYKRIVGSYSEIFNKKELWYDQLAEKINSKVAGNGIKLKRRYVLLYQIEKILNWLFRFIYSSALHIIGIERIIRIFNVFR